MTASDAIKLVEGTSDAKRFFGETPAKKYREFARLLHPDTTTAKGKLLDRAVKAFDRLTQLYGSLNGKIAHSSPQIGKWTILEPLSKGDIADLHYATAKGLVDRVVFKIVRSETDGDLMEAEYAHLGILQKAKGIEHFGKYLPRAIASLEASGRRANVLSLADGYSLSQILGFFPSGLEFRHVIWMGNRAFNALGFIHKVGVVHGAVLPEHLIYGPESHGLTLVDWCYSVTAESKKHIPARVVGRKDLYPSEFARKQPGVPQTDIYLLAASLRLAARSVPRRLSAFFDHCLAGSPKSRPTDAWALAERWTDLAEQEFGPPSYVKLEIPVS